VAIEAQPATQAKLLVVEDDEMIRLLLADMLSEIGYTVAAEAASVEEALEATRKNHFDLAILDADLKGGRSRRLPMPSWPATHDSFSSRAVAITGCWPITTGRPLNKPFQIDALKRCCKSALAKSIH
jgi:DNA-binding NtrC family response regulator